jgi:hypothetical protein
MTNLTNEQLEILRDRSGALVRFVRAIFVAIPAELKAADLQIKCARTAFAHIDGTLTDGYDLSASVAYPVEDDPTRISFSIQVDRDFNRLRDDVLTVDEAAQLGHE